MLVGPLAAVNMAEACVRCLAKLREREGERERERTAEVRPLSSVSTPVAKARASA